MKTLKQIVESYDNALTEAFTGDLYHGTSIESAENILNDNAMSVDYSTQELQISLTRSYEVASRFAFNDGIGVVLVLDRDKLKSQVGRGQLQNFDYNDYDMSIDYRSNEYDDSQDNDEDDTGGESGEFEEAVFVDISNISDILKGIFLVGDDFSELENYPAVANFPRLKTIPKER